MKPGLDVVFATYSGLPDGDPDDLLALKLLADRGLNVAVVDWRRVAADALDSRLVLLRSTWDYHHYYSEFLDWVESVGKRTKLLNDSELVRWNSDKRYLLALASAGVPIVPSVHIERSAAETLTVSQLAEILKRPEIDGCEQIIVKPTVGLSTYGVKKFKPISVDDSLQEISNHIQKLAQSSDILIQPFLTAVEKYGERALVFINGEFSHAVRKSAFQKQAAAGEAGETAATASDAEIAFGRMVLSKLLTMRQCNMPLYARVDVVPDENGQLTLLELELIEPSLFLAMAAPQAGERFAAAIAAVLD
ncbi:MAG: hypothetical protein JSS86_01555 [Cyanobacteria bacterium SZAS LIN-2]|nr:hypothetical protein [Cyanobacteria bacterium SZAS LIN-2]